MSATKEFLATIRVALASLFIIVGILAVFEYFGKTPREAITSSINYITEQVTYSTQKPVEKKNPLLIHVANQPIKKVVRQTDKIKAPRGVRNNNPLNLRISAKNNWKGERSINTDGEFEQFNNSTWGFRAATKTILTYQTKHGLKTINDIINRFAPPSENNTSNYVTFVSRKVGVDPNTPINLKNNPDLLVKLVYSMSVMEVGVHYTIDEARKGVALAMNKILEF